MVLGLFVSMMGFAYQLPDGSQEERAGRLTVLVTDQFGNEVSARVSITSVSRKRPVAVKSGQKVVLEYDLYRISAYAPGFREEEKRVRLYSSDVLAVLSLPLGRISPRSYTTLEGRIEGWSSEYAKTKVCYVKLIPVFGQVTQEAAIHADGRFRLKEFVPGKHVVVVACGDNVLCVRHIELEQEHESIEISLRE